MPTWLAILIAVATFFLGTVAESWFKVADRIVGRRTRQGDLAAVSLTPSHWERGSMEVALEEDGRGGWISAVDGIAFPLTVKNGSGEKIRNVYYGIRWEDGSREVVAEHVPVLLPSEQREGKAWEREPDEWDWWDFEQDWLERLIFFVRFQDQRGSTWENVLRGGRQPSWTSGRS